MTDDDMPELRQKLVQMNKRAKLEHFILKLDDLLAEFEQVMATQMEREYYTSDELSELLAISEIFGTQPISADDLTSCSQHEVVMVDRVLLDDLDQALYTYAPHQTKQLRVRLLNAISAASVVHYEDMTDTSAEEIAALKVAEMATRMGMTPVEVIDHFYSHDCVMVNPKGIIEK